MLHASMHVEHTLLNNSVNFADFVRGEQVARRVLPVLRKLQLT